MPKSIRRVTFYSAALFSAILASLVARQRTDLPLSDIRPDLQLKSFDLNGDNRINTFFPSEGEANLANTTLDDGRRAVDEAKNLVRRFDLNADDFLSAWERSEVDRLVNDLEATGRRNTWHSAQNIRAEKLHMVSAQESRILDEIKELKAK